MRRKPISINLEELKQKYAELQTLEKTAEFFDVHLEPLRQYFIENNIEYKKRGKYTCNHQFFEEDTPNSFYWAGFIAADGNLNKNRISITLNQKDLNHLQKLKVAVQTTAEIDVFSRTENRPQFKKSSYHFCKLRFTSANMAKNLREKFNITYGKSKSYSIPTTAVSHPYFKYFVRGIMDGDGSYAHEKNHGFLSLCGTENTIKTVFDWCNLQTGMICGDYCMRKDGLWLWKSRRLKENQAILNIIFDDQADFLHRKKETVNKLLLCKPRKITFTKEQLLSAQEQDPTHVGMAKILNTSNSTIKRRMVELSLI